MVGTCQVLINLQLGENSSQPDQAEQIHSSLSPFTRVQLVALDSSPNSGFCLLTHSCKTRDNTFYCPSGAGEAGDQDPCPNLILAVAPWPDFLMAQTHKPVAGIQLTPPKRERLEATEISLNSKGRKPQCFEHI